MGVAWLKNGLQALALLLLMASTAYSLQTSNTLHIGVLQYNAKGDIRATRNGGIWSNPVLRAEQIADIKQQVISARQIGKPLDFIALEQAIVDTTSGAFPVFSPAKNWKTLINYQNRLRNDFDENQLMYNSHYWRLANPAAVSAGYFDKLNASDVRPFLIAYFTHIGAPRIKLLVAVVHFPHSLANDPNPNTWNWTDFIQHAKKLVGNRSLKNVHLLIAGDMNEMTAKRLNNITLTQDEKIGQQTLQAVFGHIHFGIKRPFTCCSDSHYQYAIDHIATNMGKITGVHIAFPPAFQPIGNNPDDEEHKAIVGYLDTVITRQ